MGKKRGRKVEEATQITQESEEEIHKRQALNFFGLPTDLVRVQSHHANDTETFGIVIGGIPVPNDPLDSIVFIVKLDGTIAITHRRYVDPRTLQEIAEQNSVTPEEIDATFISLMQKEDWEKDFCSEIAQWMF